MDKNKLKNILDLFLTFLKIGSFTIGGGYAMLPLVQSAAVDEKKWCTEEEIIDIIALAQSLPGMFVCNLASTIGYKIAGFWGAAATSIAVVMPSIVIISVFANFYHVLTEPGIINDFFNGLRYGVYALILIASIRLFKNAVRCKEQLYLYILVFILNLVFTISPFYLLVFGFLSGILYKHYFDKEVE
ncbi:MAG: chromate transporter [Lachnospirales bacterium]